MNRKRAGWVLLSTSAVCIFGYFLTAPRGVSPTLVRLGGVLFYVGIATFLAGIVFRWSERSKRRGD